MIVNCVVDGKAFEMEQATHDAIVANIAPDAVPQLVCSDLCATEYDINCLDWPQSKREAYRILPY